MSAYQKISLIERLKVAEIRMIRWICGHTRLDKISNEVIRGEVGVTFIENKIREVRLRWFGYIRRRTMNAPVRRCEKLDRSNHKSSRGRLKKSLDRSYLTWFENFRISERHDSG